MEFLVLLLALYFAPTVFAYLRKSERTAGIFVLNLLLGWTAIGWVIALIWAFGSDSRKRRRRVVYEDE